MRATSVQLRTAFLMLALCVPGTAAAAPVAVTIKGGLSASTLHGDLPTDPFTRHSTRLGFGAGASVTLDLGGRYAVQPEVLIVTKGASLGTVDITDDTGALVGSAKVLVATRYLEFPVLARATLPATAGLEPFIVMGPTLGVRLSQELRTTGPYGGNQDLDVMKESDVGATLGAGVQHTAGPYRWMIETRYTLGLTHAAEATYSDARNGALLIMAGVAIHP